MELADLSPARLPFKLTISNLSDNISFDNVSELFKKFGPLKSAALDYDAFGQQLG
jgi:RNA recognition motif-containing protein